MAVRIINPVYPNGSNLEGYSLVENATPLDPGSLDGGFGQLTWTAPDWPLSRLLIDDDVVLIDDVKGHTSATVRAVSGGNGIVSFTADNELGKFNVDRTAQPYIGSLSGLFRYYMDLVGIFAPLSYSAPEQNVTVPGFVGNVWDHIKYLCSAYQVELAFVHDSVSVRSPRTYQAYTGRAIDSNFDVSTQAAAGAVEVNYYNHYEIVDGEVFPLNTEEPSIQQVDANETLTWSIELNASLSSVNQPVHVYTVGPENQSGTNGVYTVVGNDDLPITPAQWAAMGGDLRVELTEDPRVVNVTVVGMNYARLAPFRIAMSAGGTDYNSLHITGTGVAFDLRTLVLYTGAAPEVVSQEIGTTVENPFITSLSQAFAVGQYTAAAYSGLQQTLSGSVVDIHRKDSARGGLRPTLGDFNDTVPAGTTIGTFNAEHTGETLEEFSQEWDELRTEQLSNQVFGNVVGARIAGQNGNYRITEATITEGVVNYSAIMDTTIGDFNSAWAGGTTAEFNARFSNMTMRDFSLIPLWKE